MRELNISTTNILGDTSYPVSYIQPDHVNGERAGRKGYLSENAQQKLLESLITMSKNLNSLTLKMGFLNNDFVTSLPHFPNLEHLDFLPGKSATPQV